MTITFKMNSLPELKILKIIVTGSALQVDEIREMYQQILDEAKSLHYQRLLFDARNLRVGYSAEEIMGFMRVMHDESWFDGLRLARILKSDNYAHTLVAELAKRMQLPIRNFEDEKQATQWLMEMK